MDPLGSEIRAELARFGPQAGMAELVERWPDAVGAAIARNAWPARIARDGTRARATPPTRSGRSSSASAPPRSPRALARRRGCGSRPGPLPEPDPSRRRRAPFDGRSPEDAERARAIASSIDGRKAARKCAKSGQFEPRTGARRPPDLIHFSCLAKPAFCRHFLRMAKTQAKAGYSAKDITVLEGLEPVRLRPGHVHRLDRHRAASTTWSTRSSTTPSTRRSRATTTRSRSRSTRTTRSRSSTAARGIPVDEVEGTGHLGARGRPDEAARRRQVRRRRLQGLRRPARRRRLRRQRALRLARSPTVERDGKIYRQEFARGVPQGAMQESGRARETGTTISFLPDASIFDETEFHAPTLISRLREMAFLTKGLRITFTDERVDGETVEFHYEGGIKDFVALHQRVEGHRAQARRLLRERDRRTARSRSRCSGTTPTRSRSSRSPTTSTRTRAARTSPASRPR